MNYKNKKRTIYNIICIIFFVVFLFLSVFFYLSKSNNNKNNSVLSNNIDSFDIEIIHKCKNNNCIVTDKDNNIITTFDEKTDKYVAGKVYSLNNVSDYLYQDDLKIFSSPSGKIAPGSSNTYRFVVRNKTNSLIKYKIKMYEESDYKINMVYRLKCGDLYVIGNSKKWVTVDELETSFQTLKSNLSQGFSLEWKWLYEGDDDSDTLAGKNMNSAYKLDIKIYFEEG